MITKLDQLKNAATAATRLARAVAQGQETEVNPLVRDGRRALCEECPRREAQFCGLCGCWLAAKVRLATENCPLGKW